MRGGLIPQLRAARAALVAVLANPGICWLELGWILSTAASWIFQVAILIVAYRTDGAVAVAGVGLARMIPATVTAPLAGMLTVRFRGHHALVAAHLVRCAAVGLAGLTLAAHWPAAVTLIGVAVESAAAVLVRPIQMGLLPALARSPAELVAANVASSTGEGLGSLLGPAVGGVLTAAAGAPASCLVALAALLFAALAAGAAHVPDAAVHFAPASASVAEQLSAGAATLRRRPVHAVMIGCFIAQTVVRGMMNVLLVVAAIELLGMGDAGVGTLNVAVGLGGLAGAIAALGFVARPRLALPFALALVAWGVPLAVIGAAPSAPVAVGALIVLGAGNAALDVSGFTILQRTLPNAQRVAVLALLEGLAGAGVAFGSVVAPPLLQAIGARPSLVLTGLILPATAALSWAVLRHVDDDAVVPEHEMVLLRGLPMFAALPLTVIEHIASRLSRVEFRPGDELTRQGDPGDCFYVIDSGRLEIERDGLPVEQRGPLTAVGEIALLRDVPRTATVRAATPTVAYALRGTDFLAAVTGHASSLTAARGMADDRLAVLAGPAST